MGSTLVAERRWRANEVMLFMRPVLSAGCCRLLIIEGHMCNVTVGFEDFLFQTSYSILFVPWLMQSQLRSYLVLRRAMQGRPSLIQGGAGWRHDWIRKIEDAPHVRSTLWSVGEVQFQSLVNCMRRLEEDGTMDEGGN
jgi:hypothetical protein